MSGRRLHCDRECAGDLCARCQRIEDQEFANETTFADVPPWPFSRRAMSERLAVTGGLEGGVGRCREGAVGSGVPQVG